MRPYFRFFCIYPEMRLLDNMGVVFLIFRETYMLFSMVSAVNSAQRTQFVHIISVLFWVLHCCLLIKATPVGKGVCWCAFGFHFSDHEHFVTYLLDLYLPSVEKCLNPFPIFYLGYLLFCCWVVRVLNHVYHINPFSDV